MSNPDLAARPPALRRHNRTLVIVMILVALAAAVSGTLYLRHYGFYNKQAEEIRFH